MEYDDLELTSKKEQVLTPDDGFRLVVRLMRRYVDRIEYRAASLSRMTPYRYSPVRYVKGSDVEPPIE